MEKQYEITEFSTLSDLLDKLDNTEVMASKVDAPCWFALPVDNPIGDLLSNKFIRKALNSFIESKYYDKIEQLFNQSQKVTPTTFPALFNILKRCSEKLGLDSIPPLVVSEKLKGINALTIGADKFAYIIISPMIITLLDEKEIEFLIGHECGHILQNDLTIHTVYGLLNNYKSKNQILGGMVSDMISTPINYWHRCSEITSDRAGAICCGDLEVAQRMILFSEFGYNTIRRSECVDMIAKCKSEHQDAIKNLFEHDSVHPMTSKRLLAIELFYGIINEMGTSHIQLIRKCCDINNQIII